MKWLWWPVAIVGGVFAFVLATQKERVLTAVSDVVTEVVGVNVKALVPYQTLVSLESQNTGVPMTWINAFMLTESSGRERAFRAEPKISDASYGLMQLLFRTAKGLGYTGTPDGLYDPAANIKLGVKLMAQLIARHGLDIRRVYSAYNSGNPDSYKTSTQVAKHVSNMLVNFQKVGGVLPA